MLAPWKNSCWTVVLDKALRVPWNARRSNQSIPKQNNPEYSLGGLTLKLQYFGHLMRKAGSLEKTQMLEKIEGRRRRGWQRLDGITDSMNLSLSMLQEMVKNREAWHSVVHGITQSQTRLSDLITTKEDSGFMSSLTFPFSSLRQNFTNQEGI